MGIAEALDARCMWTVQGGAWHDPTVRTLLVDEGLPQTPIRPSRRSVASDGYRPTIAACADDKLASCACRHGRAGSHPLQRRLFRGYYLKNQKIDGMGRTMNYRLYLLGSARHIRATESFIAENDVRAIGIAESVLCSCCDNFAGYEVWNGTTMIADDRTLPEHSRLWLITQASQRDVLDLEDRVRRNFKQISKAGSEKMRYRMCLLGKSSDIRAAESFLAEDDDRANEIALSVFSACCDDFDGYEVWNSATVISRGRGPQQPGHWWTITQASQREVLDLEDRMQRTFASVSKSQQLLDATAKLRTLIAGERIRYRYRYRYRGLVDQIERSKNCMKPTSRALERLAHLYCHTLIAESTRRYLPHLSRPCAIPRKATCIIQSRGAMAQASALCTLEGHARCATGKSGRLRCRRKPR